MSVYGRIGKTAGIVLGAAGLAGVGATIALRRPLPRTTGALRLPGLSAPVNVLRDHWGVPHIYAANNADLFMAQGYVHAQDRLWQMEFQRRIGNGQMSELFGPLALPTDRFVRILGFGRVARKEVETLNDNTRTAIDAYVRGINAYIEQHRTRLPLEFSILRFQPRPWEPADVLVWGKMMALSLCDNWTVEILRARIVAAVGEERAAQLDPHYRDDHPLVIPNGVRYSRDIGADALRLAADASPFVNGVEGGQGSNGWVAGGTRTTSGKPLLANDPHLAIQMPSFWYENHLIGGDYHVTGASIPGTPGILIGHNEWIAWGVTNGMTDVQDLYIERFDPHDPTRYEFRGEWEQAQIIRETITVKGKTQPHIEEVRITRHGPIITPFLPTEDDRRPTEDDRRPTEDDRRPTTDGGRPTEDDRRPTEDDRRPTTDGQRTEDLALRWTALDPSRIMTSVLNINRAHDWASFRAALADWTVPAQNFVYADVEGHIGYALGGDLPIRAKGNGRLPVPGWTGEYEWTGIIPHDQMPHAFDPADDVIVTANNRIIDEHYPQPIYGEWLSGYRAARIQQLLEQTAQHDLRSFAAIHGDQRSLPGLELAALAGRLPIDSVVAQHARDALAAWDGELTATSIGGTIYAQLRRNLLTTAYAEIAEALEIVTGIGALASMPGNGFMERLSVPILLRRVTNREDNWLMGEQTWDDVLAEAWSKTVGDLRQAFGDDVRTWRYGRRHNLTIRHPLGAVRALAPLFNRGPFATGGDTDTVCMGYLPARYAGAPYYIAPSYRQICDTADWDRSLSIHPTGQSGQPGSKHYADFIKPWLNVQFHPMLWSRARVEEATINRIRLEPEQA
jgi:penicillin amidase